MTMDKVTDILYTVVIQGGIKMRIDQTGVQTNIHPKATNIIEEAGRTEATVQTPKSVKMSTQRTQKESTTLKNQEVQYAKTEAMAEKSSVEKEHEVIKAIEKANKHIRTYDRRLEFVIHDKTKQIMIKVINTEDDSTIREIPSEKVLDMVAHLWEMAGLLVDEHR